MWLTPSLAATVLAAIREGRSRLECSLDLGRSKQAVSLSAEGLEAADGTRVSARELALVEGAGRGCFLYEGGRLEPIEVSARYFCKLIPTGEAPTFEVDGIQMHRTTGTFPFRNALESARSVVRKGDVVLDTCGGLGYTAMAAARLGASRVVSVEVDPCVRAIARLNPWSEEYFSNAVIVLVEAESAEYAARQPEGSFDSVIHDPPRFSRAGHLYGLAFYAELARVLRPRGRLFHYTGDPYSRGRGRAFVEGVMRRLSEAGFETKRVDRLQGVLGTLR